MLKRATKQQKTQMRQYQDQEFRNIEDTQRLQFEEFTIAWDNYMADYETTAYISLEKLKERHMNEYQEFQEKIRADLRKKMKFSKDLLDLRYKQDKLIKLQDYA